MSGNKKFKSTNYKIRHIRDLKDMLNSSAELYGERASFLVKNVPGGKYVPVSFVQMRNDVNALGTALIDLGLKDKHIAVIGENRYEWTISDLAAVCGTGVVVPLDKDLPKSELANMAERAHLTAIIYSGKIEKNLMEALESENIKVPYLISMDAEKSDETRYSLRELMEKGRKLVKNGDGRFINAEIDPEAMSILLFTSGTTGLAKGVMLSHRNIVSNVMNMAKHVNVYGMRSLSILPLHHTYEFTCDQMTCIYQGGTVVICEGLKYIVKNMEESRANMLIGVPLVFEMMHRRIWKQAEKTGKVKALKTGLTIAKTLNRFNLKMKGIFKDVHKAFGGEMKLFVSGAAAIDPAIVEDFNLMGINMLQGYGMTENSPIIAVHRDRYHKPDSVGAALPGTEMKIIDQDEDGIGEVICRGPSVMMGYYEDPAATAETLRDGWLYTGDYGFLDNEGFLHLTGRKKNVIINKNGKNIFPEEVEYYLGRSKYIAEVVVTGEEDPDGGDLLVTAHIFPDQEALAEDGISTDEAELRQFFKAEIDRINNQMSSYKRVKRFNIRSAEFNKTSTKKIKRSEV